MFEQGVVAEVAAVEAIGPTASQAIGFKPDPFIDRRNYRRVRPAGRRFKQQTRNYAKRQMTWFRHQPYEILSAESCGRSLMPFATDVSRTGLPVFRSRRPDGDLERDNLEL